MDTKLLHKYFQGQTSKEEEKLIMDWAESSPQNYRTYLKERKIWNALLIHKSNKIAHSAPRKQRFNLWTVANIAASLTLLTVLSWMGYQRSEQAEVLQTLVVPTGQRAQVLLGDGSTIWLNSNSSLSYPSSFNGKTREVTLNGEGYFEIAKDKRKPFIVKTKKYDIQVLGTTFNVYAYENNPHFETSLLQGSIDVSERENKEHHIILKPNEMLTEIDGQLQKQAIEDFNIFKWKDGIISLDDVPFAKLMSLFESYFDIQIQIENQQALDYRCTGKFRQSDGIEYALKVIQRDAHFNYERDDENNVIYIK